VLATVVGGKAAVAGGRPAVAGGRPAVAGDRAAVAGDRAAVAAVGKIIKATGGRATAAVGGRVTQKVGDWLQPYCKGSLVLKGSAVTEYFAFLVVVQATDKQFGVDHRDQSQGTLPGPKQDLALQAANSHQLRDDHLNQ
jgi:hypothetical protein